MTDIEITKLCAEAMEYALTGLKISEPAIKCATPRGLIFAFDPLHDDAQAMALVKKLKLYVLWGRSYLTNEDCWTVAPIYQGDGFGVAITQNVDLNRAICERVAQLQKDKNESQLV